MKYRRLTPPLTLALALVTSACAADVERAGSEPDSQSPPDPVFYSPEELVMGVDLSYVNQILDRGGVYADSLGKRSPYRIFADHGANAVRLRLWHDPSWVRTEAYEDDTVPLYSGLDDVASAAVASREAGMQVLLDFHYSDIWSDPNGQEVPAAWAHIRELEVLEDSVYRYTRGALERLAAEGALPEMVQVGNETNCGVLSTSDEPGFPRLSTCEGEWANQGAVLNAGIRAVRDVSPEIRVVLHIAQPEFVGPWFDALTTVGGVSDFDVIGFSYYEKWSEEPLNGIADHVADWRARFGKEVMLVETAYPWTMENADGYGNILGEDALAPGYPATPRGQLSYMRDLVQQVVDGGGSGVFYWEPAWITSGLTDLWGTGSSWDNATLFDQVGRAHAGMEYLTLDYGLKP